MKLLLPLFIFILAGCTNLSPQERRQNADALAATQQWHKLPIPTSDFILTAYVPPVMAASETLAIYIEGDGWAWTTSSQPSTDPTPRDPIGLKLAMRHAPGNAAYLGRPCQYIEAADTRGCEVGYWTGRRFAPEVIVVTNQAVDALKRRFQANKLMLVGYSGGGAVAALVAARRNDVAELVTVAGNLDHATWTANHRVDPLDGSLNPADAADALQNIPQMHFVGGRDNNITPAVANAYAARFPPDKRPRIQIVPNADHFCCWVEQWRVLLSEVIATQVNGLVD